MATKFNFKSQVCTTRDQSERLLSLGLKRETADCALLPLTDKVTSVLVKPSANDIKNTIPAWSLHRLLCIIPKYIQVPDNVWEYKHDLYLSIDEELHVRYYEEGVDEPCFDKSFLKDDLYQNCVSCIEWLIKKGYFNKDYLI